MNRAFAKPLMEPGTLCIYRIPGSVKARLVKAGQWKGGSVGLVSQVNAPLSYHRFLHTLPHIGPLVGISDQFLTPIHGFSPRHIAATFLDQLATDEKILDNKSLLQAEIPTLMGETTVEVNAPKASPWRWDVTVNGMQLATTEDQWHVDALRHLAKVLLEMANAHQQAVG